MRGPFIICAPPRGSKEISPSHQRCPPLRPFLLSLNQVSGYLFELHCLELVSLFDIRFPSPSSHKQAFNSFKHPPLSVSSSFTTSSIPLLPLPTHCGPLGTGPAGGPVCTDVSSQDTSAAYLRGTSSKRQREPRDRFRSAILVAARARERGVRNGSRRHLATSKQIVRCRAHRLTRVRSSQGGAAVSPSFVVLKRWEERRQDA